MNRSRVSAHWFPAVKRALNKSAEQKEKPAQALEKSWTQRVETVTDDWILVKAQRDSATEWMKDRLSGTGCWRPPQGFIMSSALSRPSESIQSYLLLLDYQGS
jgi:hypothetical protein